MAAPSAPPNPKPFDFTYHPSCSPFAVSLQEHLSSNNSPDVIYKHIVIGALVHWHAVDTTTMDPSTPPSRILLVQRSATDSFPNCWEVPGGMCDAEDPSILYAVARELWEETGFKATNVGPVIGRPQFFNFGPDAPVCKMLFAVDVEMKGTGDGNGPMQPVLNPEEHQRFVWASESEVTERRVGELELEFTNQALQETVLAAFDHFRE